MRNAEKRAVIISQVENENITEKLEEALQKIGFKGEGQVLIKPNMCAAKYIPGAVTSPLIIYNLVKLLRETAEEVIVGESDGYNYSCNLAFKKTGIKEAVEKAGGQILNLSRDKLVQVNLKESNIRKLFLPKTLFEVDSIINVPVMKTHEFTVYSGALKNLFGLIPDRKRIFLHPHIDEVLFNLYKLIKPKTIMDALIAMERNGPTRGLPVRMNLILASNCPLALDMIATEIMGLNWREISYLNYIFQKAKMERQSIKVIGYKAEYLRRFTPPTVDLPVKLQLKIYEHALLTKLVFSCTEFTKVLQKIVSQYRILKGTI
ncbi:MAG: DUF362 domain-containing protein [Candidatus Bathyarchaeia archaeon]